MKTLAFVLAIMALAAPAKPAKTVETRVPASDSRITYVARTLRADDGSVSFDWSASTVRICFKGSALSVTAFDSHKDYINVWVDEEPSAQPGKVLTVEGDCSLVLAQGLDPKAEHSVVIQKRTEAEQGRMTLKEFVCQGEIRKADGLKKRQIEFVGDSYTCGYGSENSVSTDPFRPEDKNSSKTYAAICGRYFDADVLTISHSGQGICRNYNDVGRGRHMPERYLGTFDEDDKYSWDASADAFRPAVTVIYLGTNDFSVGRQPTFSEFKDGYLRLLGSIKANWGEDHPIICVASKCDPRLFDYVQRIVEDFGMSNVFCTGFFPGVHHDDNRDLGASWHPSYSGHIKIAYALIPYIATVTGWELTDNPIK